MKISCLRFFAKPVAALEPKTAPATPQPSEIRSGFVSYVINTMDVRCEDVHTGSSQIRRCAVENGVTMLTSLDTVRVLLDVLEEITLGIATIDA